MPDASDSWQGLPEDQRRAFLLEKLSELCKIYNRTHEFFNTEPVSRVMVLRAKLENDLRKVIEQEIEYDHSRRSFK